MNTSTSKDSGDNGGNGGDSPTKDKLFDPTIDMLINDFDDERTLEEEEALAADEDEDEELSNLEKNRYSSDSQFHHPGTPYRPRDPLATLFDAYDQEGNMPLEELLALYHGNNSNYEETSSEGEEEIEDEDMDNGDPQICEPVVEKEPSPTPQRHSKLSILYEPLMDDTDDSRNLRSVSRLSDDEEYGSGEEDEQKYRKKILIGDDHQAQVSEGLADDDDSPHIEGDELLWSPQELNSEEVEEYLRKAQQLRKPPIPNGTVLRDDEEALYVLHQCEYRAEEALGRLQAQPLQPPSDAAKNINNLIWSEEECKNFEAGLRSYGKDFNLIQQNKVTTRSVGDLVQFYYLWKKTERHDVFANKIRLEKKKYAVHPGFTDFMDRFLENQDSDHTTVSPGISTVHGKPPDT